MSAGGRHPRFGQPSWTALGETLQMTLLLSILATLAISVTLLSFYPVPIPSAISSGLPSDDLPGSVQDAYMLPVASSSGNTERTVSNDAYTGEAVTIPDNTSDQSLWGYADMFEPGIVTAILVSVDLSHPSQGDLKIVLTAPDGTEVILHNREGGNTPYLVKEYTSATSSALASLAGQVSDGRWMLSVGDYSQGRVGTMEGIRVALTYILLPPLPNPIQTVGEISESPDIPIPDDTDGQDTSLVLDIIDGGSVSDVFVLANITHPYRGDLRVVLTAPDGTEAVLHGRSGGSIDDLWLKLPDDDDVNPFLPMLGINATGRWMLSVGDYSPDHAGTIHDWDIRVRHEKQPPAPDHPVPGYSHTVQPDIAIPDDTDSQAVSSVIHIPYEGVLTEIYVSVDITHPYRGDLRVVLTAPDGTEAVLHGRSGGGQNNVVTVYSSDTGKKNLERLVGSGTAGDWTISVGDYGDGDAGTLNRWGMTLEYDKPF